MSLPNTYEKWVLTNGCPCANCRTIRDRFAPDPQSIEAAEPQRAVFKHPALVAPYEPADIYKAALPIDSKERKDTPVYSGVLSYFPLAIAEVAKLSKAGNDKHNPGQPLHWSKDKSNDHADCIARHLLEIGTRDPDDGHLHSTKLAWRALANLQIELENAAKTKAA